jgi:hypothetical protein
MEYSHALQYHLSKITILSVWLLFEIIYLVATSNVISLVIIAVQFQILIIAALLVFSLASAHSSCSETWTLGSFEALSVVNLVPVI